VSKLVPLSILQWEVPPVPNREIGKPGHFAWIPLNKLMVDESYQRPIELAGKKNIKKIVEEFHWTKYGPLIVSPRFGDVFAIIDGQHHAVAALCHGGIKECPCWVLTCTPEEEARAFHTINGIVTRVHPQYLFRARIASGDPGAVAADEAARAAGAKIMPYPAQAHQLKPGETLAGKTIEACLGRYGREVVVTAMELITRTGDGNPGLMKADLIEGFCDALFKHPKWLARKEEARAAVNERSVWKIHQDSMQAYGKGGTTIRLQVSAHLAAVLNMRLGDGGKGAAPVKTLAEQARYQAKRDHIEAVAPGKPAPPPRPAALPVSVPGPAAAVKRDLLPPSPPAVLSKERTGPQPAPRPVPQPPQRPEDGLRKGVDFDHQGKLKITTYLIRKGHMASVQGQNYRIDGRILDKWEALELVNEHRAKADLPELQMSEVA
jgi:hypothetical protein